MGNCTEKFISEMNISRQAQDDYAIKSYERARAAQEAGVLAWEICDVVIQDKKGNKTLNKDEEC